MRPLSDFAGGILTWRQCQNSENSFELVVGDVRDEPAEVVAELVWQKNYGTLALARTSEGNFTYKRGGFLHPRLTLRRAGEEKDMALFEPNWGLKGIKGSLSLPSGGRYEWDVNVWTSGSFWQDLNERKVVQFKSMATWNGKLYAKVQTHERFNSRADSALLVTFGQYLNTLLYWDSQSSQTVMSAF
jgi:hypothetical protein